MDHIIADNIKALRSKFDYSEKFVSRYLNIPLKKYKEYESYEEITPVKVVEALAHLYHIDEYAFYEEDIIHQHEAVFTFNIEHLSDEDIATVARFKKIIMNYLIISEQYDKIG